MKRLAYLLLAAVALAPHVHAQLVITEVMAKSGSGGTNDWFELTNFGSSSINVSGYKMDDDSNSFGNAVALLGITSIASGESVIFIEGDAGTDDTGFKTFWGTSSVQVGTYTGSGISFGSGGDAVTIFDSVGNVITGTSFGSATTGASFYYAASIAPAASYTLTNVSATGVAGAFTSVSAVGDIGSPGVSAVPEPASFALLFGLGILGIAVTKRSGRA